MELFLDSDGLIAFDSRSGVSVGNFLSRVGVFAGGLKAEGYLLIMGLGGGLRQGGICFGFIFGVPHIYIYIYMMSL
jgi:hypothetical protein